MIGISAINLDEDDNDGDNDDDDVAGLDTMMLIITGIDPSVLEVNIGGNIIPIPAIIIIVRIMVVTLYSIIRLEK